MSAALQTNLFDNAPEPSWLDELIAQLPAETHADPDKLRWYQREAVLAIQKGFEEHRAQLLVMATGCGKTQVFCVVANEFDGDVLILAHRDELIDQARSRFEKMFGGFVDVEKAGYHSSPRSHITVGSIASFHKKRREKMSPNRYGLIIVDEAHRACAKTYQDTLSYFASAKVLGVTATPDRSDEKAMGKVFDHVPYIFDIEDGIEQGYLVPVKGQRIDVKEIDISTVNTSGGDLVMGELDEAMAKAVDPIVQETLRIVEERQTILFWPGLRSAEYAMHKLNEKKPGCCAFLSGDTDTFIRRQVVRDFRDGKYQFLSNVRIANEGFDCPPVSVIVQGCPTKSRSFYAQTVGRGTRPLPGIVDELGTADARRGAILHSEKPSCLILDFVGNSGKHTLQTVDDVLGGNYSEAEVALAKKKREPGGDALQALKDARAELKALAQKAKVRATVQVTPFDPFNVFGVVIEDDERYANRFGVEPASREQLDWFRSRGVAEADLRGLSKRAAIKLRDQFKHRMIAGLATYKQMRQLQKFGINDKRVKYEAAKKAMDYISSKEWGRNGAVDPKELRTIIEHRRQPGEE